MNPASLKPACGTIIPVDAEEPSLILPLLMLATESGEVWCWDTWIIWRRASFDSDALVAWNSGWANKSGWKSGLIRSDVLLRSHGLYSVSVPSWEVHRCAWHVSHFHLRYLVCFGWRMIYAKICKASRLQEHFQKWWFCESMWIIWACLCWWAKQHCSLQSIFCFCQYQAR